MAAPPILALGAGVSQPRVNEPTPKSESPAKGAKSGTSKASGARRASTDVGDVTETLETPWHAAEEAYDQSDAGRARKQRWSGFKGSADEETLPFRFGPGFAPPKGFKAPTRFFGEPAINYFMRFSALLHEFYRKHGEEVGVSMYGLSPGDEPSSLLRRTRFRRRFNLEDPSI